MALPPRLWRRPGHRKAHPVSTAPTAAEIRAAREARNRLKKFVCPNCGQIARGSRGSQLICGRCYLTDHAIHIMRRVSA